MKVLTCGAALRRLQAFHDEELQVDDQIAVSAHLAWCDACAAKFAELDVLREALRAATPGRLAFSDEESTDLQVAVISRLRAERTVSFSARMHDLFEDMHLVYIGLAATMATLVCVVTMLAMMHFATNMRSDSLAAVVNILSAGSARSSAPPAPPVDTRILMPRALDADFRPTTDIQDGEVEFMLAAVVTREGKVANLELLHASSGRPVAPGTVEAKAAEEFMGEVSRTKFEPARVDGLPVAMNMVWLVSHTTVSRTGKRALDRRAVAAAKKRMA